jgi:hypothetical protein
LRLVGAVRHALIRHACFRANEKHFSQDGSYVALATEPRDAAAGHPSTKRDSVCVDARGDAIPRVVDTRGDTVAAVGFYARAAAGESCQEDDGAEGE